MELKQAIILLVTHGIPILFFMYTATNVLIRNVRKTEHILLSLLALGYLLLFVEEYVRNQIPIVYSAHLSVWLGSIALIIPCLCLHFLVNFTQLNHFLPKYFFPAIFYLPLLFVLINLVTGAQLISAQEFEQIGMWILPVYTPGYYTAIIFGTIIEVVFLIIILIVKYKSPLKEQHSIYNILFIGVLLTFIWQIVFSYINYGAKLPPYPYLYGGIIWCYCLQLAMKKYDFLAFYDKRYEKLFNMNPNAILLMDQHGNVKTANPRSEMFFKAIQLDMKGFYYLLDDYVQQQIALNNPVNNYEMDFIHNNQRRVLLLHIDFVLIENAVHLLFILQDITTTKEQQEELHFIAFHDALTRLPNRRYFQQQFEEALQLATKHDHTITLYLLDLDQFKLINDTRGHIAGDEILQSVATILKNVVDTHGLVARLAGDEFIFYINHSTTTQQSNEVIQTIKNQFVEATIKYGNLPLNLSIGISQFPSDATDSQALINIADHKMYLMKKENTSIPIQ